MSEKYVVASRGSLLGLRGQHWLPGNVIPDGAMPVEALAAHVKAGTLVLEETASSGAREAPAVVVPFGPPEPPRVIQFVENVPASERLPQREQRVGKWTHDPALLAGKPLDELLVMVMETDDKAKLPETVADAIKLLSSEYVAK